MKTFNCRLSLLVGLLWAGTLTAYDFEYDAGDIEGEKDSTGITYTLSVSKGDLGTSYDFDTKEGVTSGSPTGIDINVSSGGATGTKAYPNDSLPTANFTISMNGKLIPPSGGSGTQPTWGASGNAKAPFYIKSNQDDGAKEIIVPAGTSVTYTAYEGNSSKSSNWTVNGQTKNNESSIIFSRNWWDVPGWFSASMGTPVPGVYNISASPTDNSSKSDAGKMTVLTTFFSKGNSPGYDDFTDWQKDEKSSDKATAYYANPQKGQSGTVYIAVKKGTSSSTVNLSLNPSSISDEIEITKSGTSVSIDKTTTKISTKIILNAAAAGETTLKAKLDSHIFPRQAVIYSFNEKVSSYWLVYVGAEYNGTTIYPAPPPSLSNVNLTLQQAVAQIEITHATNILYNNHPPVTKVNNKNIYVCQWSEEEINELITDIDVPNKTGVILIMHGYVQNQQTTFGLSSSGGRNNEVSFIWTGASYENAYLTMERPYIIPHEIAHHFLGASHVSGDKHNLLTEESNFENLGRYNCLRKNQWGDFHD